MAEKTIVILYNKPGAKANPDENDVLEQVNLVEENLSLLGYDVKQLSFSFKIKKVIRGLKILKPDMVFNLVESIDNKGEFIYWAPSLLNKMKIRFTGCGLESMFLTSNKFLAKKMMRSAGIPTANYFATNQIHLLEKSKKYIVKPIWEDGSLDLDEENVFTPDQQKALKRISSMPSSHYFIEEYIDGREFNISMLQDGENIIVLPHAEITFEGFAENKPKIVGYKAKWETESFEYSNTKRVFPDPENNPSLHEKLEEISLNCWKEFSLSGYARVDFRVDMNGNPYVLEVNPNPCISEDSGFIAAAEKGGLTKKDVIEKIVQSTSFEVKNG